MCLCAPIGGQGEEKGEGWVRPVELKRKNGVGGRGGGRSRNCQRYV